MAKVKSDRDIVERSGFCAIFPKGEGDYLIIQEKIFKGMDVEQIYKKAKEHHETVKR